MDGSTREKVFVFGSAIPLIVFCLIRMWVIPGSGVTLFLGILAILGVFYLFLFGPLKSITFKALSAEATLMKEKIQEVKRDADEAAEMKGLIWAILTESKKSQAEIINIQERVSLLAGQLEAVEEEVAPSTVSLSNVEVELVNNVLQAIVHFTPSDNKPLGAVMFEADVLGDSEARIDKFWPSGVTSLSESDSGQIHPNGKRAVLTYSSAGPPMTINLTVSEKCRVRIGGSCLDEDSIDIDIELKQEQGQDQE